MSRLLWPSLPPHLARPVARGLDLLRNAAGSLTWGPALAIAKPAILSILSQVQVGTLILVDEPEQKEHVFGRLLSAKQGRQNGVSSVLGVMDAPRVKLVVKDEAFWMRLLLFADMGFAEAFMLGELECAHLTSFFQVSCSEATPVECHIEYLTSFLS